MDQDEFERAWKVVGSKFEKCDDGLLRNPRLEAVRSKKDEVSSKRSNASLKRWSANGDANAYAKPMQRKMKNTLTSKGKEREEKVEPEVRLIVWPAWAGPKTLSAWEEFKVYRWVEHKDKYKSVNSEQRAVNILSRLFPGGEECVNALEYAMGRGWKFPVDPAEHKYPTERKAVSTGWNPRA